MPTDNVSVCNLQFQKSTVTFNGKPTWTNIGQNLTIKWDTTNDWWYIEGWSPGQQILSGNTIAPVGEWIPLEDADYFYESSPNACTDCLSSVICLTNDNKIRFYSYKNPDVLLKEYHLESVYNHVNMDFKCIFIFILVLYR